MGHGDRAHSRALSHLIALSLAVAFFNLLPLPHLDGTHILSAFLQELGTANSDPAFVAGLGISVPPVPSLLESFMAQARKVRLLRQLAIYEVQTVRGMTIFTSVVGTLLLGSTLAVELSSI